MGEHPRGRTLVRLWLLLLPGLLACAREEQKPPAPAPRATTGAVTPAPMPAATPVPQSVALAPAIQAALAAGSEPELARLTPAERERLVALYTPRAFAALWIDADGRPTADARAALELLSGAASEGLDPAEYRGAGLQGLAALPSGAAAPAAESVAFDLGLSAAVLRFLQHLHSGRVDPRAIGFKMTTPPDVHDYAALLAKALAEHRLTETVAELRPPLALYRRLHAALPRYRRLAAAPVVELAAPASKSVRPGEPYGSLEDLRRLLVDLGDLPAEAAAAELPATYDGVLVDGVKRFQRRHGLADDGALGKGTLAALNVPLAWRARQIELALERLRWAPHLDPDRFLAVNIPMYRLWVWQGIPTDGAPSFGMNAIVGRALDQQTPVFVEQMRYVVFRPYWNVTPSILRGEVLPALRRDPGYLQRQDMEIVAGQGDNAPTVALTPETLEQLARGRLRVRQRPGPRNALGLVKFVFPNDHNVYLHSTPAPTLFQRSRRDFSHGCVRVEDPVKLAEWALREEGWTRERIVKAMAAPRPVTATLQRPIQVILFYITAAVMPEDGAVHFAEDIYRHDARLDRALTERSRLAAAESAPPTAP